MRPIIDLHCDLLSYLGYVPWSTPMDTEAIGCAVPHLQAGNVCLQVLAAFTLTEARSADFGMQQARTFRRLVEDGVFREWTGVGDWDEAVHGEAVFVTPAIENASNICEEDEALDKGLARLENWMGIAGKPLYITITHHAENRFGGGNMTEGIGLKEDGKVLLEYLDGRGIAVDLSHTSDQMADELLDHIDKKGLQLRILASHSNFREVTKHARNLPFALLKEVVRREGVIGINFVRDFVGRHHPERLQDHIRFAFETVAGECVAWGADFFAPGLMPPEQAFRAPFFHPGQEHAGRYGEILEGLPGLGERELDGICFGKVVRFLGV
ncbi:MAG: membrane dipeptidase [Bacteroidota bacterium]